MERAGIGERRGRHQATPFHANVLTIAESGCSCETSSPRGLSRRNHTTFVSKIVVVRGDTMTDKHAISDVPWVAVYSTMLVALMLCGQARRPGDTPKTAMK